MTTSHLYQLPHLSEVGASVEVDAADCFVTPGSHWCPRVGTLMLSSVKHESSRLKSECSGPRGGCSVHLTVHELLGRLDGHGLTSPRGRPGGVIRRGTWLAKPLGSPPGEPGLPRGPWRESGATKACNRVEQDGPFKEATRVLIGLVLKEIPCKILL